MRIKMHNNWYSEIFLYIVGLLVNTHILIAYHLKSLCDLYRTVKVSEEKKKSIKIK